MKLLILLFRFVEGFAGLIGILMLAPLFRTLEVPAGNQWMLWTLYLAVLCIVAEWFVKTFFNA